MKQGQFNHNLMVLILVLLVSYSYTRNVAGVRYIRCSKPNEYLNFNQIEAYRTNGDNVAYGKPITQSSVYPGTVANWLVDGVSDRWVSTEKQPDNWILLDLEYDYYDIWRVKFVNRKDCCRERLNGMKCELQDSNKKTVDHFTLGGSLPVHDVTTKYGAEWLRQVDRCDHHHYIHSVRLLSDRSYRDWMNVAEVEVYDIHDHNIAHKAKVTGSSLYSPSFPHSYLVDGNTRTFAHTKNFMNEWFRVHLKKSHNDIKRIVIHNRHDCCQGRTNGISVYFEDEYGNGLERVVLHGNGPYTIVPKCQDFNTRRKKKLRKFR